MSSLKDTFVSALKAGAAGAAANLFAPKDAPAPAAAAAPAPSGGMLDGLPSWALPAAAVGVVALVALKR